MDCAEIEEAVGREWDARAKNFEHEGKFRLPTGKVLWYNLYSYKPVCSKAVPFKILFDMMRNGASEEELAAFDKTYHGTRETTLEVPVAAIFQKLPVDVPSGQLVEKYAIEIMKDIGMIHAMGAFGDFMDSDSLLVVNPATGYGETYPGGTFEREGIPDRPGEKAIILTLTMLIRWLSKPELN